jgi:hypothetical protein
MIRDALGVADRPVAGGSSTLGLYRIAQHGPHVHTLSEVIIGCGVLIGMGLDKRRRDRKSKDRLDGMKATKLIGLLAGTLLLGLVAGGWMGARRTAHVMARMIFAKPQVDQAFIASQQAEWLAHLRLNEQKDVIKDMQQCIDNEVSAIALWDGVARPDDKTRQERDKFLVAVKVYRESYPSTGLDAGRINVLLDTISGRNPKSTCKSGICRLDDMRLAKLNTITNSP